MTNDLPLDECARRLIAMGAQYVLITGTHENTPQVVNDLYDSEGVVRSDHWERLPGSYHGSGCTLASAMAAGLAHRLSVSEARTRCAGLHLADVGRTVSGQEWGNSFRIVFSGRAGPKKTAMPELEKAILARTLCHHPGRSRSGRAVDPRASGTPWRRQRSSSIATSSAMPRSKPKSRSALCALCRRYGACFMVNDDLALALAVDADGVHLGARRWRSGGRPASAWPGQAARRVVLRGLRPGTGRRCGRRRLCRLRCGLSVADQAACAAGAAVAVRALPGRAGGCRPAPSAALHWTTLPR